MHPKGGNQKIHFQSKINEPMWRKWKTIYNSSQKLKNEIFQRGHDSIYSSHHRIEMEEQNMIENKTRRSREELSKREKWTQSKD
jgi:hypothetical protein